MPTSSSSTIDFEQTLAKLEAIVKKMENESLDLEASISAFEEGVRLSAQCQQALQAAKQRVEIILQNTPQETQQPLDETETDGYD